MEPFSFQGSKDLYADQDPAAPPQAQPSSSNASASFAGSYTHEAPKAGEEYGLKKYEGPLSSRKAVETAIQNIPSSAKKLAYETVYPFLHPLQTVEGATTLAKAAYSGAKKGLGYELAPEEEKGLGAVKGAFGEQFAKYGSLPAFGRALVEDPLGTVAEPAQFLSGLGAGARILGTTGKLGKLAQAAERVGEFTDPASLAIKGGVKAADVLGERVVSPATSAAFAISTGKPFNELQDAERAGLINNPSFRHHFSGSGTQEDAIQNVMDAFQAAKEKRSQDYLASSQGWRANQTNLGFNDVNQAWWDARDRFSQSGIPYEMAGPGLEHAARIINKWQDATPGNMSELDALKRDLGSLYNHPEIRKSPESIAILTDIKNKVRDTIANHDPEYARTMEQYENASDALAKVNTELQAGKLDKKSASQAMRQIVRANDTDTGRRVIEHLSEHNPDLPYIIAGSDLSQKMPGGARQAILSGLGIAATQFGPGLMALDPSTWKNFLLASAGAAATSPHVAGAVKHAIGRARSIVPKMEAEAPARLARTISTQAVVPAAEAAREPEITGEVLPMKDIRFYRASGGRISRGMNAQMLIAAVERAKADGQKATEGILDQPDEHVVHALKVANEHI